MDELQATDFELHTCQAVLFTPDEEVSSAKILRGPYSSNREWSERFDAEPVTLPIPAGAPNDIPKLILESKSKSWKCEFASGRVNVFWRKSSEGPTLSTSSEFFHIVGPILTEYIQFQRARIGRIAAVLHRMVEHQSPGLLLNNHFCQERWRKAPFDQPERFELHTHKRFLLAERFQVNSWVKNKAVKGSIGDRPFSAVIVEQDINTLPEDADTSDFNEAEVESFFSAASAELDEILSLYYPGGA